MDLANQIAALRKKCGFSQEELGEKMGVSRQAVSKWESGKAVPELEKLKELSRIFGVSLGELLQPEDSYQQKEQDFLAAGEENWLPRPAVPAKRKVYIAIFCAISACILILSAATIYMQAQIQGLNGQLKRIQNDLSGMRPEWEMAIGSLQAKIEESLQKSDSAISEYHYDVLSFLPIHKQVRVKFSVTPKLCTENTQMVLTFSGADFEPITLENITRDGSVFWGTVSLPVSHAIRVSAAFLENGESASEELETIYGLDDYLLTVTSSFQGEMTQYAIIDQSNGSLAINGSLVVEARMPDSTYGALKNYPDSGTVKLYKDGKVFRSYELNFYENGTKPNYDQGGSAVSEFLTSVAAAVPMEEIFRNEEWRKITIEVTVTDRFGIQYKQTAYSFGEEEKPGALNETEILYPTK